MLLLRALFVTFFVAATVSANCCYSDVHEACRAKSDKIGTLKNCTAKYGDFDLLEIDLQKYANAHIEFSFDYLLMSTYFGNYEANREGFKHLYRKLSDSTWEDAIDLMKYIAKRGGKMSFDQQPVFRQLCTANKVFELNEFESLSVALDNQKQLANETLRIYSQAVSHNKNDPAVAHYIEEHFMEQQSDSVRALAGYVNDLRRMFNEHDVSVAMFLFDEYLKKVA